MVAGPSSGQEGVVKGNQESGAVSRRKNGFVLEESKICRQRRSEVKERTTGGQEKGGWKRKCGRGEDLPR